MNKTDEERIELEKKDVAYDTFDDDVGDDAPSTFIHSEKKKPGKIEDFFAWSIRNTV